MYTATVIDSKKDRNRMHEVTEMQLHRRDKMKETTKLNVCRVETVMLFLKTVAEKRYHTSILRVTRND